MAHSTRQTWCSASWRSSASAASSSCSTPGRWEKFVTQDIKALHIRFLPEQTAEMDISSRQFIKRAEFINADTWVNGKEEQPQPEP